MSQKTNYFKVGLLVIGATVVLVAAVLFLSTGSFGEEPVYIETYFDESVQGLSVGSPVTYRGVQVGNVAQITFTRYVYDLDPSDETFRGKGRYVYVLIDIRPMFKQAYTEGTSREFIQSLVDDGLRFQLKPQGITGLVALQAEYFDPEENPPFDVPWEPKYPYLPSTPSLFTRLADAMSALSRRVEDLDIEGVVDNMNQVLLTANTTLKDASLSSIGQEVEGLVVDLRSTNSRIQEILNDSSVDGMRDDLAASISGVRRIIEDSKGEVAGSFASIDNAMTKVDTIIEKIDIFLGEEGGKEGALSHVTDTLDSVRVSVERLPEAVEEFNDIMRNANQTLSIQRRNISEVLIGLKAVLEDVRALTEETKRNPSRLLFGEAPPRSEIDQR